MNATDWALLIAAGGFVLSAVVSVLTVGIAWGVMRGELHAVRDGLAAAGSSVEMQNLAFRMGRIESLFEYRLSERITGRHSSPPGAMP